ncbi:MAG: xanthine dehydrogenase family protein molybdopterin-binding subunit [Chloroflexi bacterium]|nr:xanthine dehydrogenase family protein molybdopterin-binding subunit [Chloroflexota bacterium]
MPEEFAVLGKRLPRKDAVEKATGQLKFVADMQLPGMLYARFLRSPHAHARIVRIDTSKAEALPGVKAVLTHKNVPKVHPRRKLEFLLDETAHCAGEEVAAVAATTKEIAEEALKLIEVEYEVLPAVLDTIEAMKPDAPLAHIDYGSNFYHGTPVHPAPRCRPDGWLPVEVGDVDKGFAEADFVLEADYETPIQYTCSPTPRAVVCQWTGEKLTCWADTQVTTRVWQDLAQSLKMPQSDVRVISSNPVGGYGGKEPERTATLTALLAKKTGRPVKAAFHRAEDFVSTHRRLSYKGHEKIGVKKDGTITALEHRIIANFGKDSPYGMMILATSASGTCSMLYPVANSRFEGCLIITNTPGHAAFNGFGDPEAGFCLERIVDEAAEKIDMDPVEFRLKNCMRPGTRGIELRPILGLTDTGDLGKREIDWGIVGEDIRLQECLRLAAEKSGWKKKWKGWRTPVAVNGSRRRGIGVAIGIHHSAYHLSAATVKMNQDGSANVMSSFVEMGSGFGTAVSQVVAEALGIRYEDVNVILADTAVTPPGFGNVGSGGTSSGIAAAKHAADDAKRQLLAIAAPKLGVKPEELEAGNRRIYVKARPEVGIPIAEICLAGFQVTGTAVNPPVEEIIDEKTGKMINSYAIAATISEVEVDTETGQLDVLRITSAHDCGRILNPTLAENQVNLSMTLGNGWVRSENFIIDRSTGVVINPNLLDYKVMTFMDMPDYDDISEITVEGPCAWGPFGAKGMSETATTTQAPALANAIYNAIGVRIRGDHLTPDRILAALGK